MSVPVAGSAGAIEQGGNLSEGVRQASKLTIDIPYRLCELKDFLGYVEIESALDRPGELTYSARLFHSYFHSDLQHRWTDCDPRFVNFCLIPSVFLDHQRLWPDAIHERLRVSD